MATGAITGAIVGTSLLGAYSAKKQADVAESQAEGQEALQKESLEIQKQALEQQKQASDEQLAFYRQQYDDYRNIYGDVEQNLRDYYLDLTPETFTQAGIATAEVEYNRASNQVRSALASRGLIGSGVELEALTRLEGERARTRSQIQQQAPLQVAQAQQNFLGTGRGIQQQAISGIGGAFSNIAGAYGNIASSAGQTQALSQAGAQYYTGLAQQSSAQAGQALGSGISSYLTYQALQNPATASQALRLGR